MDEKNGTKLQPKMIKMGLESGSKPRAKWFQTSCKATGSAGFADPIYDIDVIEYTVAINDSTYTVAINDVEYTASINDSTYTVQVD